ncbi:MAG: MlrC C-terminal domain-containing protein [Planctomycetaceae bacterium]
MVEANLDVPSVVPLNDPEAAEKCHAAGVGAVIEIELGHKLDPRWGQPRTFTGEVLRLSDGKFVYTGGQWDGFEADMGPSALFRIGSVLVVIMSKATYDFADEQIRALGLDPIQAKFIVAKNPMNYRHAYGAIAKGIFILDTYGPTPGTLRHVKFEKLQPPYFPVVDDIPGFEPTLLK